MSSLFTTRYTRHRNDSAAVRSSTAGAPNVAKSPAAGLDLSAKTVYGTLADLITSLEEAQAAGRLQSRLKILTHPAFGIVRDPTLLRALVAVNFLDMLERFARGRIHLPDVVFLGVLTAGCVALAGRMLDEDFRRARKTWRHAADALAWGILAVFSVAWAFRADAVWDVHAASELDAREQQVPNRLLGARQIG